MLTTLWTFIWCRGEERSIFEVACKRRVFKNFSRILKSPIACTFLKCKQVWLHVFQSINIRLFRMHVSSDEFSQHTQPINPHQIPLLSVPPVTCSSESVTTLVYYLAYALLHGDHNSNSLFVLMLTPVMFAEFSSLVGSVGATFTSKKIMAKSACNSHVFRHILHSCMYWT